MTIRGLGDNPTPDELAAAGVTPSSVALLQNVPYGPNASGVGTYQQPASSPDWLMWGAIALGVVFVLGMAKR